MLDAVFISMGSAKRATACLIRDHHFATAFYRPLIRRGQHLGYRVFAAAIAGAPAQPITENQAEELFA